MTFLLAIALIILIKLSWNFIIRLEPAGIFALIWIALIGLVLLSQNVVIVRFTGLLYIILSVSAYIMGAHFCDTCYSPMVGKDAQVLSFHENYALVALAVLLVLSLVNPLYSLTLHGFKITSLLSVSALLNMNEAISEDRYSGRDITTTFNQVFLIFSYAAPLVGGFCYRLGGRMTKALSILTLLSGLIVALTQAMKMGLITCIILWISGFIICSYSYRLPIKINFKYITYAVAGFLLLMVVLFLSLTLRFGLLNEKTIELTIDKFIGYALGSLSCFDIWFESYDHLSLTYGAKTFWGISNPLGILERQQGAYQEFINIGQGGRMIISNVYTGFRFLIEDFGPWFSVLIMGATGFFSKFCLKRLLAGLQMIPNQILLSVCYAYVFWSFATSFFAYTSYIVMFFVAYAVLSVVQTPMKSS